VSANPLGFHVFTQRSLNNSTAKTPNYDKNAHVEAFNSILEIEFLQPKYFMTYGQAYSETIEFMEFYNANRIHGSLKYRTPIEVFELFQSGEILNIPEIKL
jgi:putative transposase